MILTVYQPWDFSYNNNLYYIWKSWKILYTLSGLLILLSTSFWSLYKVYKLLPLWFWSWFNRISLYSLFKYVNGKVWIQSASHGFMYRCSLGPQGSFLLSQFLLTVEQRSTESRAEPDPLQNLWMEEEGWQPHRTTDRRAVTRAQNTSLPQCFYPVALPSTPCFTQKGPKLGPGSLICHCFLPLLI